MTEKLGFVALACLALAAFLLLSGCTANPNGNIQAYNFCCPYDLNPPSWCNGTQIYDCSNRTGTHVCYNISNMSQVLAPICPDTVIDPCSKNNCTAMVCLKPRIQADLKASSADTEMGTAKKTGSSAAGLVGKYCTFAPLSSNIVKQAKQTGAFVNSFRLGIQGNFSDYDRARYYFPYSDYFGEQPDISRSVVDRFSRYTKIEMKTVPTGPCTCITGSAFGGAPLIISQQKCGTYWNNCYSAGGTLKWGPPGGGTVTEQTYVENTPEVCEPMDSAGKITAINPDRYACFQNGQSVKDFTFAKFNGDDGLAQLACRLWCSPASLACDKNQELLATGVKMGFDDLDRKPDIQTFVDFGSFDPKNSAGGGYRNLLYQLYSCPAPPAACPAPKGTYYTDPKAPGPVGGYVYECNSPFDCMSGDCDMAGYQRTACLVEDPITHLVTSEDCGCVYLSSGMDCDRFYEEKYGQSCEKFAESDSRRDSCGTGRAMCNEALHKTNKRILVCKHDNTWKGKSTGPPGGGWDNQGFMESSFQFGDGGQSGAYALNHWQSGGNCNADSNLGCIIANQQTGVARVGENFEFTRHFNMQSGTVDGHACFGKNWPHDAMAQYTDETSCKTANGIWSEHREFYPQFHADLLTNGRGYKTAYAAVPDWQPVSEGNIDDYKFDGAAYGLGGAFVVASQGYNEENKKAFNPDTSKWTGTIEELIKTFPFMEKCGITVDDIEEINLGHVDDPNNPTDAQKRAREYGWVGVEGRVQPPRTHEIDFYQSSGWGSPLSPQKIFRITNFRNCQTDGNGWLQLQTYGMCMPKTFLTMASQKVENAYFKDKYTSPSTGHEYPPRADYTPDTVGHAGYCPTNCKLSGEICTCDKKEYGLDPISRLGSQATHTYPEMGLLANKIDELQGAGALPVLDLTEYNFMPPPEDPFILDKGSPFWPRSPDACAADTGAPAKQVCVEISSNSKEQTLQNCINGNNGYEYRYECVFPPHKDVLLSYLNKRHSAALVVVGRLDAGMTNVPELRERVKEAKRGCQKCMIGVEYERALHMRELAGIYDNDLNQTIKLVTGVTDGEGEAAMKLRSALPAGTGMDNLVLVLHEDLTANPPTDYDTAINTSMNTSRHVLSHVGWPTLVLLDYFPTQTPGSNMNGDETKELYAAYLARADSLVEGGMIGIMLPKLDSASDWKKEDWQPVNSHIYPNLNPMIDLATQKVTDSQQFCAAEKGTSGFLNPIFRSSVMKLGAVDSCMPQLCSKSELDTKQCRQTCVDGGYYTGYTQISGSDPELAKTLKCPEMCYRKPGVEPTQKNDFCRNMLGSVSCFSMSAANPVPDIDNPSPYLIADLTDARADIIGSMKVPCALESNGANYTYVSRYSRQLKSDPVIFPRFGSKGVSCVDSVKGGDITACNQFVPPVVDTINICDR